MTRVVALAAWLLAAPRLGMAQTLPPVAPPLVSDRPGFGESTEVVGRSVVQFESGLTFARVNPQQRQFTAPELLARIGIARRFEVRVASDGYVAQSAETTAGSAWSHGHADLELGAKLKLLDAARAGVDLAVIPFMSLPTASEGFSTARYDPGFEIAALRRLPREFDLAATFNTADATSDSGRAWQRELSVGLVHGLGGPVDAYWEADGQFDGGRCGCSFDAGVTLAAGADGQFDVEAGHRLGGTGPEWFIAGGFVIRYRRH